MSEAAFGAAIRKVLTFEGGYANDPADPGGETNFGISRRSYPDIDIRNLNVEEATAIYHRDFWLSPGYDALPDVIGAKMLDIAVNMGPRTANKLLQRAANHSGWQPSLLIDGSLGPRTRAAAGSVRPDVLLQALKTEAENHYLDIVAANPAMHRYLRGWLQRARS